MLGFLDEFLRQSLDLGNAEGYFSRDLCARVIWEDSLTEGEHAQCLFPDSPVSSRHMAPLCFQKHFLPQKTDAVTVLSYIDDLSPNKPETAFNKFFYSEICFFLCFLTKEAIDNLPMVVK